MKILYDTQVFDWQISGGISRYFTEVIKRVDLDAGVEAILNCTHSYNTYIQKTKWLKAGPKMQGVDFKGKLRLVKEANQIINRRFSNKYLKAGKQDLFHPTYFDPYFLKYLGNKPFVLTVHDLTNEKFNDGSALTQKMLGWKKELIPKANHIISVSENTKKDLIQYYQVEPSKITTIYLSGDLNTTAGKLSAPGSAGKPYLLFVGSRGGYKNFDNFCIEVAPLLVKYDLDLYIVGGGALNTTETALLKSRGINNRVAAFPQVTDERLAAFYANALLFIFPSIYEGFGIPALEAMRYNCPVLLSNNSSLPEVGADAAAYFDPLVNGALTEAAEKLILNANLLTEMKTKGLKQVLNFSWDITAKKHLDVYRDLLTRQS